MGTGVGLAVGVGVGVGVTGGLGEAVVVGAGVTGADPPARGGRVAVAAERFGPGTEESVAAALGLGDASSSSAGVMEGWVWVSGAGDGATERCRALK